METQLQEMQQKTAFDAPQKAKKRAVRRILSGTRKGERLYPLFEVLVRNNISMAELARRCNLVKQTIALRFATDDCRLSDLEMMADVLGYELVWELRKKPI